MNMRRNNEEQPAGRQKRKFRLSGLIYHNSFVLACSFLAALIGWFVTAAGSSDLNRTVYNVPIQFTMSAEAEADGLRVWGSSYQTVDIEVSGSTMITSKLTAEDFEVTAALNPTSTVGELMANAGLNTLIGMGTVFVVLILISLIISCFKVIPKIQANAARKKAAQKEVAGVDNAVTQIVEEETVEEAEEDDCELVAVIAAAIAASEGPATTDGLVVRSIRRRSADRNKTNKQSILGGNKK